jgi:SAP domain
MKMALRLCPSSGNGSDIIHTLPMLHMSQREWFDDDGDFDIELFSPGEERNDGDSNASTKSKRRSIGIVDADPVLVESIKDSLSKLRHVDLQEALRLRGLRANGPKEELQARLLNSLMDDAGLML